MNYKVTVKASNKIFVIKNKPIRSPFETIATEDELKLIKSRLKYYGLFDKDFSIEPLSIEVDKKKDYLYIPSKRYPDKKNRTPKSTGSSIEVPNKTLVESKPKQKIVKNIKKVKYKVQETILNPGQLISNPGKKVEQKINDNSNNIEIKIEELTIKSTSLLDKFLNLES